MNKFPKTNELDNKNKKKTPFSLYAKSNFPPDESFLTEPVSRAAGEHQTPANLESSSSSPCRFRRRERQHPPFSYAGRRFNGTHGDRDDQGSPHMLLIMCCGDTNDERGAATGVTACAFLTGS